MSFNYTNCENKELCANCGMCCIKCGCDYFPPDFEKIDIETVERILDDGRTSIIAYLIFKEIKGKLIIDPMLYLRARNIYRPEIDLLSLKTSCASLEDDGCHFSIEERPSGGALLIPRPNLECYYEIDRDAEMQKWQKYQKVLQRVVKRRTGKSLHEKLKEDAENLFLAILNKEYDGVSNRELKDIKEILRDLANVYPNEFENAIERHEKTGPYRVRNIKNPK